ncbi:MAG: DegV family protein [Dehalococcoidia bacterium]|nr:DegV family protein [Dehalococcoidia bacterium]
MPNVAIVTDSVADLPPQVAEEFGITVVPLVLRFGTDVYRDGLDLSPDEFYERLRGSKALPATSVPPPVAFADVYDKLAEKTNEIVVISLTSRLSATYQVALQAVGLMKKRCRVEVLDSQWAVMAQGFITIAAAKAARAGASLDEVLDAARRTMRRVDMRAAFDTLQYLERGGRIGKAQALLGSLLKVNPIIGLKDGEVYPVARERSRAKAVDYLHDFVTSFGNVEGLAVEYAADLDEANKLVQRLRSEYPQIPIYLSRTSPVIGTHTGPGLILVTVLGDRQSAAPQR